MPVYLLHGFRWPRAGFTGIRVHAVVHDLEDCSAEYIQNENSKLELLRSFRKAFPDIMKELETPGHGIEFLEQYDPDDELSLESVSQPYAYVADRVVMIAAGSNAIPFPQISGPNPMGGMSPMSPMSPMSNTSKSPRTYNGSTSSVMSTPNPRALSLNVEEVIADGPGLTAKAWEAFADLRDKIAEGEKIGWWIIYNGDPQRTYDEIEDEEEEEDDDGTEVGEDFGMEYRPVTRERNFVPFFEKERSIPFQQTTPTRPRTAGATTSSPLSSGSTFTVFPPMPIPIREKGRRTPGMTAKLKEGKELRDEMVLEPVKSKESPKTQGFRRRFFGRKS